MLQAHNGDMFHNIYILYPRTEQCARSDLNGNKPGVFRIGYFLHY